MATQEDRSLSSGMSLPQWMKTKMNDRLDFEQSAFSPTELDDSFIFYYRNKPRGNIEKKENITSLVESSKAFAPVVSKKPDFSKHTPYCQKFIEKSIDSTTAQLVKFPKELSETKTKTKSSGVDDGFKGEAALCGSSVIRVAHQMVSGKNIRGFNIEKDKTCDVPPDSFNPEIRRGSKSLPSSPTTSPATSPKSNRRVNKYFTGPFVDSEHQGSWILSNLLMSKRQTLSQTSIAEEQTQIAPTLKAPQSNEISQTKKTQIFVPKPSELREMNFWSPTSM